MQKLFKLILICSLLISNLYAQESAFLGIHSNGVSSSKAKQLNFENTEGRYITRIVKNTAAERMGLQPFDYLIGMDGKTFTEDYTLHDALDATQPGASVQVAFIRNGQSQSAIGVLGTRSEADRNSHRPDREDPFLGVAVSHYNWNEKVEGVKVDITDCSTAQAMGMQDGDVIQQIDNIPIIDWHDVGAAIDNRAVGDPIRVVFKRDNTTFEETLPIMSEYETERAECNEVAQEENLAIATPEPEESWDTETVEVEMENVTIEEAEAMKASKGIDMPVVNNLQIEQLNIFPNPSNGIFNVQFDLPNTGFTTIRLFNSSGRLIYQYDLGEFTGNFSDRVDLTNNYRGTYFLEIRQDDLTLTKKLIVVN